MTRRDALLKLYLIVVVFAVAFVFRPDFIFFAFCALMASAEIKFDPLPPLKALETRAAVWMAIASGTILNVLIGGVVWYVLPHGPEPAANIKSVLWTFFLIITGANLHYVYGIIFDRLWNVNISITRIRHL